VADRPDAPVFAEPWEAQVFALAVALHERGAFTWSEWSSALAAEVQRAGDRVTYYHQWLAALEQLVADKGIADGATLRRYRDAWKRAAERTQHGQPILLEADDLP
jgi:nitrile hydratase accessory protein